MMNVRTIGFGQIEVDESDIYVFRQGIPGFEAYSKYIVIAPLETAPFAYMQSVEEENVSFLVTDPFYFFGDYDFTLPQAIQEDLNLESEQNIRVLNIVSISKDMSEVTVNLLAPVILNAKDKLGLQFILHDTNYKVKHRLGLASQEQPAGRDNGC